MNSKILELYNKSCVELIDTHDFNGGTTVSKQFDAELFANLIIKECMKHVEWVGLANTAHSYPIQTANAINLRIKKKFGIENE